MRKILLYCVVFVSAFTALAQGKKESRNLIVVTLDGFRWQEVFRGACPELLKNDKYVVDTECRQQFAGGDALERRKKLLPFIWNKIGSQGQLYGNRDVSNNMNCANPYWFSYPGYHELWVGAVNKKVCSNLKIENPDVTVLEFLNNQPDFRNTVSVFATWEVFPFILGERCSGIMVNAGIEPVKSLRVLTSDEQKMNARQASLGVRTDSVTFHLAFEHLRQERPKILYIALDETDHSAHKDRYDNYLIAAHHADEWLSKLWNWIQSDPDYKDNTTLVLTTDHGRGQNSKKTWRHHGRLTRGSGQIWMAVIGPDTPGTGEVTIHQQLYQKQIASSLAALMGYTYTNDFQVGKVIDSMINSPELVAEVSHAIGTR